MPKSLLYALLMLVCLGCTKNQQAPQPVQTGGSWTVYEARIQSSYSEVQAGSGYRLHFVDRSGTNGLSFLFRKRPDADARYTPAADTSAALMVRIELEHGGRRYHSVEQPTVSLTAKILQGKLRLSGMVVRMQPDSAGVQDLPLDFELTEY